MRTIHKFLIPYRLTEIIPAITMPRAARPLSVGMQGQDLYVWALVDPEAPIAEHMFAVRGTGHPITPEVEQGDFVGTVFDGPDVWHVFSLGDIG